MEETTAGERVEAQRLKSGEMQETQVKPCCLISTFFLVAVH